MKYNIKIHILIMLLSSILAMMMFVSSASAYDNIGNYEKDKNLELFLGCSYNNTYCANTFVCNISVFNQDGLLINNQRMSNQSYPQFNYTIQASNISNTGLYYGRQVCCGSIGCKDYSFEFNVNFQGKEYGTIEGIIYVVMFGLIGCIFLASSYFAIDLPFSNNNGSNGNVISINWKKYLKMFLFGLSYTSLIGIFYFAWNVSYGILEFEEMGGLFYTFYTISYIIAIPLMAILFVFSLVLFVNDSKTQRMIERGLTVK